MKPRACALAGAFLIGVAALAVDLLALGATIVHAGLLGLVCVGAGLLTDRLLPRAWLVPVAAGLPAAWSLAYQAPVLVLVFALLVPAVALLAPSDRRLAAPLVALLAAAGTYVLVDGVRGPAIAALVAGLATLARPERPTRGQLAFVRAACLLGPGLVLLALVAANAATGYADELAVRRVLALALGLAGLTALVAIAGLGVATLLESADEAQRYAWVGLAAGLAVPAGLLVTFDPNRVLAAAPAAAVPIALGAATSIARLDQAAAWPAKAALLPAVVALALQAGL